MSDWTEPSRPYNHNYVLNTLNLLSQGDIYGDNSQWIEFAKNLSEMDIQYDDIQKLTFEQFEIIKKVMSISLEHLSQESQTLQ